MKTKKLVTFILGIALIGGFFFSGVYVGYSQESFSQKVISFFKKDVLAVEKESVKDFSLFWKAWNTIDQKLVTDTSKVSSEDRMYGAIKGMVDSFGDPYTTFFPPQENALFESEITGSFSGVGIEIGQKEGVLTVISPLKGTPAYKAGIQPGDVILRINDSLTNDMTTTKAVSLIRGEEGTEVVLTIIRDSFVEPKNFSLKRERIQLPVIETTKRDDKGVFVIHLYNFSSDSQRLFQEAFNQYKVSGYKKLLIDLRGNPGGYLDSAVAIAGLFVPEGEIIVKEVGKIKEETLTSRGPVLFDKNREKLIILVDKGSASASEILAGALEEYGIGTLVGEKTFGKGSVQEIIKLTPKTSLKVTVAKWYTPKGVSISDTGLTPSILIPKENESKKDTQLEKTLELF